MITQTKLKQQNKKRIAKIIYLLKLKGLSQQKIADDLCIQRASVNRVINGHARSQRVEQWLKENLGI